jgi:DnaJ-class molecular chaperone
MNYYDILGIERGASPQDIKTAYRKLAMEHHPDRGGDESKFQRISQAYDTLSDPNKRSRYDDEINIQAQFNTGNFRSFEDIHNVHNMFNDLFDRHGFNFGGRPRSWHGQTRAKNLDLNIKCKITLLDSFIGKDLEAHYSMPSGRKETVVINIPPGIKSGETIVFRGMGDDTYPQVQRGNLNITIEVAQDLNFIRRGDDITTIIEIDPIEAMIGCVKPIENINGTLLQLKIKAGTTHGGEYIIANMGFKNLRTDRMGNLVVIVYIRIPEIKNKNIIKKLEEIKNEIDNLSK